MKWFLDTEFNENGRTIDLISIGLVSETGESYYAVSSEFDRNACNDWVKANVLPLLPPFDMLGNARGESIWKPRAEIADEIRALVLRDDDRPEFWAYFADYDWVALCQLYGPMVALPKGFPFYCRDLKQLMDERGVKKSMLPEQSGVEHDALADACWVRDAHAWIEANK